MDRVLCALEVCTVFVAIGTSGMIEPAASFVGQTKARTFYVGTGEPLNLASLDETFTGKAGEFLPMLFDVGIDTAGDLTAGCYEIRQLLTCWPEF
jgi:NAD-dependent SIR2 family protein deacetylase